MRGLQAGYESSEMLNKYCSLSAATVCTNEYEYEYARSIAWLCAQVYKDLDEMKRSIENPEAIAVQSYCTQYCTVLYTNAL